MPLWSGRDVVIEAKIVKQASCRHLNPHHPATSPESDEAQQIHDPHFTSINR